MTALRSRSPVDDPRGPEPVLSAVGHPGLEAALRSILVAAEAHGVVVKLAVLDGTGRVLRIPLGALGGWSAQSDGLTGRDGN